MSDSTVTETPCFKCGGLISWQWISCEGHNYHPGCAPGGPVPMTVACANCDTLQRAIAVEREEHARAIEQARREEREAIASTLDVQRREHEQYTGHVAGETFCEDYGCSTLKVIADAIRARSQ